MARAGNEADEIRSNRTSGSEPCETIDSANTFSEETSLLHSTIDPETPHYKATEVILTPGTEDQATILNNEATPKNVFAIIGLLLVGVFISNADGTLVLATYGTISSEFSALSDASWLTTSYSLAVCSVQPVTGKLSDIYGRKTVLLISYILFAIGCIICGIGQAMWQVIAGRIVSGLGAAGMTVVVSIIITDMVPLIQVASWRSYVNVVATLGRSVGGPVGGLLADTVGWRWLFVGQGPLITLAIILVALKLPSHSSPGDSSRRGLPSRLRRVDFFGAFVLAVTVVSLLSALSLGGQNYPWSHPIVISLGIASLIFGMIFVTWESNFALEPVFPPSLVVKRDVATSYAIMGLQTAAQLAMMYSIPLYFRATQNSSNTAAGAHLFPAVVGNTVGGLLAGYLIQRTGRYKFLTVLATMSSSLSYALLILRWNGKISTWESLEIVPGGFGTGLAGASTFISLTRTLQSSEIAIATSGMYLAGGVGMVVGIAISSSVQMGSLVVILRASLASFYESEKIMEKVVSDVGSIAGLEKEVQKVVVRGYVKSLEYSHLVSLICAVTALAIACTMREHKLR